MSSCVLLPKRERE
ncbi:hypothetical protein F383_16194 [Gossypium arboreum]|uniref:Uncharacterized protein n=1 Tax=Gossypium arboreum TaxID=29729 RepID=A0A0B0PZ98_GOSAR|nr:hypothetical protein F383_16194 [Gossypium arboreum]